MIYNKYIVFATSLCEIVHGWSLYGSQRVYNSKYNKIRDVEVGKLNFFHTTDTHGWLGSHKVEPNYNADWGDFISFISHFKKNRVGEDNDLLIIDTGDKRDGNGLSDATQPSGIETSRIFNEVDFDLLTIGNHELYTGERATFEYYSTAMSKKFKDKYVCSNVDYIHEDGTRVPFGKKYAYFKTENTKTKVLALSFMFHFKGKNPRAKVTPAIKEVQKEWFQQMFKKYNESTIDVLIVIGHIPATDPENHEINLLHEYLRQYYPNVIIQYFGGHSHIRDFVQLDSKSTCLQSGRFCETVGFVSIDDTKSRTPKIKRRYIDFNLNSFRHHANVTDLATSKGIEVSRDIQNTRLKLELDKYYGEVPHTYYMMARPMDSEENIYYLIKNKILPRLTSTKVIHDIDQIIMLNTGAIRFDLFKGPFTKDSEYIVLPFENSWKYIVLPKKIAIQIEDYLNEQPVIAALAPPQVGSLYKISKMHKCPFIKHPDLTEGHTTVDDFGCHGDDTPHNSQIQYHVPNVIQYSNFTKSADQVQFIFFSFLTDSVLEAVNSMTNPMTETKFTVNDCKDFDGQSAKQLLREYIMEISK